MMHSFSAILGLGLVVLSCLLPAQAWSEEEERVVGIEGTIASVEVTTELRPSGSRTFEITTIRIVLNTGEKLRVYEDASMRVAEADGLLDAYAKAGISQLTFSAEKLTKDASSGDFATWAKLAPGTEVIIRAPMHSVVGAVAESDEAVIYVVQPASR